MIACLIVLSVSSVVLAWVCISARVRLADAVAKKRALEELNAAKTEDLKLQREALRNEFAELATRLLGEKQGDLTRANADSVKMLFTDLKERLDRYEKRVETATVNSQQLGAEMKTRVDSLQEFAKEARAFTSALVGGNKIQGNKGEDILANLLEQSGLQKDVHYETQAGLRDEGRPDVKVYDVRNHHVIFIDAKMNIKDYIAAYNLPDDAAHKEEKKRALKQHVTSIRRQIDGLAAKDYANTIAPREGFVNLPLVAMFCPFNTVLEAALIEDPALVQYAYEKGIVLVTPLTLWGYLWLVSWGWKQHEVERKYDEIQELGRDVVTAVDSLLNDLATVGDALEKARTAYDGLYRRATEDKGQMSVKRVARKLLAYGVTPKGRLKKLSDPPCICEE